MASIAARRRRFILGPLVALALVGYPSLPSTGSFTTPPGTSPPASPNPTSDARALVRKLLNMAYEAEAVYRVDNEVFAAAVGAELEALKGLEPGVAWGKEVVVEVPSEEGEDNLTVVLRAPLPSGESLCLAEVTADVPEANRWYARVAVGKKCPPAGPGMPGWSLDESVWG